MALKLLFKVLNMNESFGNIKILCVEDDMFLSSLICKKLGELGATLFVADNGERALEIVKNEMPNVVLLDILLPGMDGFEILEKIKTNKQTSHIAVVVLSNLSQKSDIEKGMKLGASKYLVKATVSLDEIVGEIQDVLQPRDKLNRRI